VHRVHAGNFNNSLIIINNCHYTATEAAGNFIVRGFIICTYTKYYGGDQIKKNEMGGTCGTYGEEERCKQGLAGET
jgi:hypothetical protein